MGLFLVELEVLELGDGRVDLVLERGRERERRGEKREREQEEEEERG